MASEVARRKNRLAEVCGAFPEVETSGAQHLTFQVHKRTFAYYLDNHQAMAGSLWCVKPLQPIRIS
jgi:hypothetical protein